MLCTKCGVKNAVLHYTKNYNGEITEHHLCQECAQEEGLFGNLSLDFGDLFKDVFGNEFIPSHTPSLRCPECGMTLDLFEKTGRMGCSECYDTFYSQITPVLKRIHGSTVHTGKLTKEVQGEVKAKRQIDRLRKELKEAITNEEFEKAASLRDQIREMEGLE
jgi:protein arginine kinase activator